MAQRRYLESENHPLNYYAGDPEKKRVAGDVQVCPKLWTSRDVGVGKAKETLHGYHLVKQTFLGLFNARDHSYSHLSIANLKRSSFNSQFENLWLVI